MHNNFQKEPAPINKSIWLLSKNLGSASEMFIGISKKDGLIVFNGKFSVIFGITKHFKSMEYSLILDFKLTEISRFAVLVVPLRHLIVKFTGEAFSPNFLWSFSVI
jgi:hypothetical protein